MDGFNQGKWINKNGEVYFQITLSDYESISAYCCCAKKWAERGDWQRILHSSRKQTPLRKILNKARYFEYMKIIAALRLKAINQTKILCDNL